MSEFKNDLIKSTSLEISVYLEEEYGIEIDYLDIAEIINLNMRDILNKIGEDNVST